jgi:hypothetical protein
MSRAGRYLELGRVEQAETEGRFPEVSGPGPHGQYLFPDTGQGLPDTSSSKDRQTDR